MGKWWVNYGYLEASSGNSLQKKKSYPIECYCFLTMPKCDQLGIAWMNIEVESDAIFNSAIFFGGFVLTKPWHARWCSLVTSPQPNAVGPKLYVNKTVHKLKSLFPLDLIGELQVRLNKQKKLFSLWKVFCPPFTQKVSKKPHLIGTWISQIASWICYVYLVPCLGSL